MGSDEGDKYITIDDDGSSEKVLVDKYVFKKGVSSRSDAKAGNTFILRAGCPPQGQKFSKWKVIEGDATIKNSDDPVTTVEVKSKDSVIKAIYSIDPNFSKPITLVVVGGSKFRERVNGEGEDSDYQKVGNSYFEKSKTDFGVQKGDKILIRANDPPMYQEFCEWKVNAGDATLNKATDTETIVTMGSESSVVAATYQRNDPSAENDTDKRIEVENGQLFEEDKEAEDEITKLYKEIEEKEKELKQKLAEINPGFKQVTKDEG